MHMLHSFFYFNAFDFGMSTTLNQEIPIAVLTVMLIIFFVYPPKYLKERGQFFH